MSQIICDTATAISTTFKQEKDLADSNALANKNFSPNPMLNGNEAPPAAATGQQLAKTAAQPRKRANKNMNAKAAMQQQQQQSHTGFGDAQITTNKSDLLLSKLFTDLNAFGLLKMSQPASNIALLSINYPERNHALILKNSVRHKGSLFDLRVENVALNGFEHDKKMIEAILGQNERFLAVLEKKSLHGDGKSSLLAVKDSKSGVLTVAAASAASSSKNDAFRICSLILNEPLTCESGKNRPLAKNSAERLNEALASRQSHFEHGEFIGHIVDAIFCRTHYRKSLPKNPDHSV